MQQIILKLGGLGLTEPPKEEDWEAHEIHLMDNRLSELPESPNCPLLNALYLQRNASLTAIPPLFFKYMPALQVLNLSNTSIKVLPKSLTMLVRLQKLFLKSCPLLMVISPHVGELGNLEELDLDETQIVELPAEIAKLTKLKCLKVSFYTHVNRSKHFSSKTMIHPGIISNLSHLTNLSIDVNQEDLRWNESVEAVVKEICCLKLVKCLGLYLPEPQLLDKCRLSNRLPIYSVLTHFRLTVGQHKRRNISRVPNKANAEFSRWDKCLKFVNGHNIPIDVRRALKHTTSFFLDHHITAKNLSEFGIENMKQLKFCLLAECNEMDTIFYGNKNIEDTFDRLSEVDIGAKQVPPSLEYLSMYYMGKLETVWKVSIPGDDRLSNLKLLTLHSCPKLTTIFSQGFIKSFVNLEQLILEDCAQVTSLVSTSSTITTDHVLPCLKKLLFLYLPELINISNGFVIAPKLQKVGFYGCPKLKTLSKRELSSTTLKLIRGEAQWWADIEWSNTEWGSRPDYLADLFFPVVDGADLRAEFIEDGDSTEVSRKTECKQQDDGSARSNLTNKDKWGAKEINLMDDKVSELPDSPRCPLLNMLYLQKNYELTVIPSLFFEHMPVLKVLDLSYTGIKSLPKSLNKLVLLQKLFLRHCKLMMEIPPQIGELENLEVLDLYGTHIMVLRKEIANLTKLKCLRVSFYGCIHYSKKMIQFEKMIQAGVILNLPELSELCIEVNPADDRWNQAFVVVMKELGCLKKLKSLSLYIPKIEVFNVQCSTSIDYYSLTNFKFTLGAHKLHLVSRVPPEVEAEFGKWHKCLRFVNGKEIPIEVSGILNRASAFFLDHHTAAISLCSFGIKNMKKLKFCLLVDCNQIDAIINGEEICSERGVYDDYGFDHDSGPSEAPVLGSLLYLNIYYLNNLRRVWKGPVSKVCLSNLKHLSFHMCPQLSVIFSSELINNFVSLEELTLEDCPLVTCLVNLAPSDATSGYFLPSLKRICLLYLPELISMSSGLCIAPNLERIAFYNCPMLKRISKMELSSKNLKVIKGESKWWKAIRWDGPEWEGQPDYLMQIFSPLSDEKDVMTQLTEDEEILMQNEGWQKQQGLDCVLEKHAINNPNPAQHAPLDTPSVHPITGFTSNLPTEPFNALTSKENQLKKIATMIQEFKDLSDAPLSIHQASSATSPALSPTMGNVHACIEEIQGINVPNSMWSSSWNFPYASRSLFSSLSRTTLSDSDMSNFPKIQISETCPSKVHSSNRESNSGSKRKRMGEEGKNLSDDSSSHGQICPSTSSCISQNTRSLNKMALQQAPSSREAILSNKFRSEKSMDQLRDASRHGFSPENAAPPAKDLQGRNSCSSNSNYHQMPPCMERGEQDDGCIRKTIERCSDGQLDVGYRGSPNYPEPESAFALLLQASSDQSSGYSDAAESRIYKNEPAAKKLRSGSGKPSTVAFRTKVSGVEVLDDGFEWRKYGKKSRKVGGSRNYYKCGHIGCSVKKRIERDVEDSSYLISTYEGVHNHSRPDKSNCQSQPVTEPNLPTREEAY